MPSLSIENKSAAQKHSLIIAGISVCIVVILALLITGCPYPQVPTVGKPIFKVHIKWAMQHAGIPDNVFGDTFNDIAYKNYSIADMEKVFTLIPTLDATPPSADWDCDNYTGEFIAYAMRILKGGAVGSISYDLRIDGYRHKLVIFFYRDSVTGDVQIAMVEPYIEWANHLDRHGLIPIGDSGRIWKFDIEFIKPIEIDI